MSAENDERGINVRHLELVGSPEQHIGEGVHQSFWGEQYIYPDDP